MILGGLNGDVEVNIGTGTTGALSVSWFPDDLNYTTADFTFRYYPGERNPEGFSIGASVGYLSSEHEDGTLGGQGPHDRLHRRVQLVAGEERAARDRDRARLEAPDRRLGQVSRRTRSRAIGKIGNRHVLLTRRITLRKTAPHGAVSLPHCEIRLGDRVVPSQPDLAACALGDDRDCEGLDDLD